MSALQNLPSNTNFLSPIGFKFSLTNYPNVNYFCQAANLPGISIGPIPIATPFNAINLSGDEVSYDELAIRFAIDENMKNWLEIHDWIIGLGLPTAESRNKYRQLKEAGELTSDAVLTILTSSMNPQIAIHFKDCFPLSLSGINFDSTTTDIEYISADVSFRYDLYTIENLLANDTTYEGVPVYTA